MFDDQMSTIAPDVSGYSDDEIRAYGGLRARPWISPPVFDGQNAIAPRRPELLGDRVDDWWHDLSTWSTWTIGTFRLVRWFPPCWPQHPALVEELMALWLHWQAVWLPATDATAPISFLRELEWSLNRIDRLWKPPCTTDAHKPQPAIAYGPGADATPDLHRWWSNDTYNTEEQPTWP